MIGYLGNNLRSRMEVPLISPVDLKAIVIEPLLTRMNGVLPGAFRPAAVNLLVGTAVHESTVGGDTRLHQLGGGPARGIYQVEPDTRRDIDENFLSFRPEVDTFVSNLLPVESDRDEQLAVNLFYATAVARLVYWRRSFSWPADPGDIAALAGIWKQHYNTALGAGTEQQFIDHFPASVLGSD